MKRPDLKIITLSSMFAALICVATLFIAVPSPIGGYFNFGDCFVLLGAFVLGPCYGMAAAGLGSALADLLTFPVYTPATLVIKALMALAAALLYRKAVKRGKSFGTTLAGMLIGGAAAELIMVVGYFLFELPMYGLEAAAGNIVMTNLPQAAVGLVAAAALFVLLERSQLLAKLQKEARHA